MKKKPKTTTRKLAKRAMTDLRRANERLVESMVEDVWIGQRAPDVRSVRAALHDDRVLVVGADADAVRGVVDALVSGARVEGVAIKPPTEDELAGMIVEHRETNPACDAEDGLDEDDGERLARD